MIETYGKVVEKGDGALRVQYRRLSTCGHCAQRDGCGVSTLGRVFAGPDDALCLKTSLDLQRGDELVLGLDESALLQAAFWAYLLPSLLMLIAALAAAAFGATQLGIALAALLGLAAGLALAAQHSARPERKQAYLPVVLRATAVGVEKHTENTGVHHEQ